MKKISKIATIVVCILITSVSHSQSLKLGVKAGLNYANTSGSNIKTEAITNYHAGLVAKVSFAKSFAIQPELIYSTQGATYKTATKDFENKLGYITIPVMLQINISNSLMLELGPQAGFLLSEKNKFDANDSKTFDFTANAGLGLKLTESLFAQARYGYGLTDIKADPKFRNSVFQLSVGILLW